MSRIRFKLLVKHGSKELYHDIKSCDPEIVVEQCLREALNDDKRKVDLFCDSQTVKVSAISNLRFSSQGPRSLDQYLR